MEKDNKISRDLYKFFSYFSSGDSLAEWSKAPDLGSGPKGRGFKSHSCQYECLLFLLALIP